MARFSKIIFYARVSSSEQVGGHGLQRQLDAMMRWLAMQGVDGIETLTLVDEGRSGYHGHHRSAGKLGELELAATAGELLGALLITENLDRFSREGHEATIDLIRHFTRNGVTVATTDGELFNAGEEADLYQVISALVKGKLNRQESAKKAERTAANWSIRRSRAQHAGVAITKLLPAWLTTDAQDRIVIITDRAALVARWFEMAHEGTGAKGIAAAMMREGIPTWGFGGRKAKVWNRSYISRTLANRAVIGEFQPHRIVDKKRVPDGEPWQGYFPAIVDSNLFAEVNANAPARKQVSGGRNGHRKVSNLFSGLLRCDECGGGLELVRHKRAGAKYVTKAGTVSRLKHDSSSLVCRTAGAGGPCSNRKHLGYHTFEKAMLDNVLHLALDDTAFSNKAEIARLNNTIAERERALEIVTAKARRLMLAWAEDGSVMAKKLAGEAEAEAKEITANLTALQRQREEAYGRASSEEHLMRVAGIRGLLESDDLAVRVPQRLKVAQGFASVIDAIWWDRDSVATVMLAGGAVNFRIHKGKIVGRVDVLNMTNVRTLRTLTHGGDRRATVALLKVERRARRPSPQANACRA